MIEGRVGSGVAGTDWVAPGVGATVVCSDGFAVVVSGDTAGALVSWAAVFG